MHIHMHMCPVPMRLQVSTTCYLHLLLTRGILRAKELREIREDAAAEVLLKSVVSSE